MANLFDAILRSLEVDAFARTMESEVASRATDYMVKSWLAHERAQGKTDEQIIASMADASRIDLDFVVKNYGPVKEGLEEEALTRLHASAVMQCTDILAAIVAKAEGRPPEPCDCFLCACQREFEADRKAKQEAVSEAQAQLKSMREQDEAIAKNWPKED